MKKLFALLLVVVMMLSLVACGSSDADKVAAYVQKNGDTMKEAFTSSFAGSSGMTCTSNIKAVGCGIVIDININELDDVDPTIKEQMQAAYDSMDSYFDGMLEMAQSELPELDSFTINVCEGDGDVLATIRID